MPQSFGEHFGKVTLSDLTQATRDFSESNLIGRGSYGSVYRGKLKESKMEVAVKVFDLEMRGAERSFVAECEALRSIQHCNLLPIITACSAVDNIGKRPTDAMFMDGLDIISFVENSFQSQIFDVIDVHLVEECKNLTQDKNVPEKEINKCLLDLVQVAFSCTRSLPSERSNMKQIASKMHAIKVSQLGWMTCKK